MPYTEEQKAKALEVFHDLKSYTKAVRKLGYPTREHLARWVKKEGLPPKKTEAYDSHKYAESPIAGTNEC